MSVLAKRNISSFLAFALGNGKDEVFIRVYAESRKKAKDIIARADLPQSGQDCQGGDEERHRIHPGLAGLFRNYKYERTARELDGCLGEDLAYIWTMWKKP